MLMHAIRDGIITGALRRTKEFCGNCGEDTCVVWITTIELPKGIEPNMRLIAYGSHLDQIKEVPHKYLGIGCGCYAKFHRQLAHIEDRMKHGHGQ